MANTGPTRFGSIPRAARLCSPETQVRAMPSRRGSKLGLTLNEAKTKLKDARKEHFDFLAARLDHITIAKMVVGIWAQVRPRKVSGDSRLRSMSFWFGATIIRGPRSVIGSTQCCGVVRLLQPRNTPDGLPGRRPSRLRIGAPFPPPSTQGAHARYPSVFGCGNPRDLRRVAPPTRAPGTLPCDTLAWDPMPDDMR